MRSIAFAVVACLAGCPGHIDTGPPPSGRSEIVRLNKRQLENSLADLLGTRPDLAVAPLPPDEANLSGFDNDGKFLRMQEGSIEAYYRVFERAITDAFAAGKPTLLRCDGGASFVIDPDAAPSGIRIETREVNAAGNVVKVRLDDTERPLGDMVVDGSVSITNVTAPFERISVRATGTLAQGVGPHLRVRVDGVEVAEATIGGTATIEATVTAPSGPSTIEIVFDNNLFVDPQNDRNVSIDAVELAVDGGESLAADACTADIAARFLRRAYRRPATDDQIARFVKLASADAHSDAALQTAVLAALLSPSFLFVSYTTNPDGRLDDHAFATRLALAMWGRGPDDELLDLAAGGTLRETATLDRQLRAMLADPRAEANLFTGFVKRWLQIELGNVAFEPGVFPGATSDQSIAIARDMEQETRMMFAEAMADGHALESLITADHTFVSPRLASIYGVTVTGDGFSRVAVDPSQRAGILTHPSVLATRSRGGLDTNLIRNGVFVLKRGFCMPIAETPPKIDISITDVGQPGIETVRDSVNARANNPACGGCHAPIDGIGMPFERLDPVGRVRDAYPNGQPVDSTQPFEGQTFTGPGDVGRYLATSGRFESCFAQFLATYGAGRELELAAVGKLIATLPDRATFFDVVRALVSSEVFDGVAPEEAP